MSASNALFFFVFPSILSQAWFVVSKPDVYKSMNGDTYVIFGQAESMTPQAHGKQKTREIRICKLAQVVQLHALILYTPLLDISVYICSCLYIYIHLMLNCL